MTMQKKYAFRHELKFVISTGEKEVLKARLRPLMELDKHAQGGQYKIRSVYFDDYWNTAYLDKMRGVQNRRKYRIRFYDDDDSRINLECKTKSGSYIFKRSVSLTRAETDSLLNGEYEFLLHKNNDLCTEMYIQCVSRVLRPCCIVDYEREPYLYTAGDVRVTLDSDIRSASLFPDVFDSTLPVAHVLGPNKLVLEVKFTSFLPSLIKKALPVSAAEHTAFSKFTNCYEKAASFNPLLRSYI
jgi:SPX domain protein involved in polyphosphate accumulation